MSVKRTSASAFSLRTVMSRVVFTSSFWLLTPVLAASATPTAPTRAIDARLSLASNDTTRSFMAPVRSSSVAMWRAADLARRQGRPSHTYIPTQLAARTAQKIAVATVPSRGGVRLAAATPAETALPTVRTIPVAPLSTPQVAATPQVATTPQGRATPLTMSPNGVPSKNDTTPAPSTTPSATAPFVVQLAPPRSSAITSSVAPPPAAPIVKTPLVAPAPGRHPAVLSSREADRRLLAQLDADLRRADSNLDRANSRLSEGQRQLSQFENVLQQAMLEAGPDAKGLHPFVRVAERYMGTPYVWGGESARGFDCSGFIIRVMRDLGYKTPPHSAALQFNYGLPIAQALLKPGDLVFFKNTYKPGISHVGIYLGNRRFIHAAGTGIGTIVSSLDTPKFQAKYAGGRRLVAAR